MIAIEGAGGHFEVVNVAGDRQVAAHARRAHAQEHFHVVNVAGDRQVAAQTERAQALDWRTGS